jgi:hypothetical protein
MTLLRRHERFSRTAAADPAMQVKLEAVRTAARDFIQDCLDFVGGRATPGAGRAKAEHDRLAKQNREAKRRALCGADPLNITGHSPAKRVEHKLARPPIEHVGNLTRALSSVHMLRGRNKLDVRQSMAAETYRDAFETVHRSLGGGMDFSGIGGSQIGVRHQQAVAIAAERLKEARDLVGSTGIVVIEHIICHGHSQEDCARLVFGGDEREKPGARDVNYAGRRLREALTELADLWHPTTRRPPIQAHRPAQTEIVAGDAGIRNMDIKPFVMR